MLRRFTDLSSIEVRLEQNHNRVPHHASDADPSTSPLVRTSGASLGYRASTPKDVSVSASPSDLTVATSLVDTRSSNFAMSCVFGFT